MLEVIAIPNPYSLIPQGYFILVVRVGFALRLLVIIEEYGHKADAIALRSPQRALHQAPTPTDLQPATPYSLLPTPYFLLPTPYSRQ